MAGRPISLGPKQTWSGWPFDSSWTMLMIILVIGNWNKTFSTVCALEMGEVEGCPYRNHSQLWTMSGRESTLWRWEDETDARDSQDKRPCRKRGGGGRRGGETDRWDSWSFPIPGSSPLGDSVVFPIVETPCNLSINLPPATHLHLVFPLLIL